MIDSFFSTIKTAGILIGVAVIIVIIIVAFRSANEHLKDRDYKQQENERKKQNEDRSRELQLKSEVRRNKYWDNLCLVYGDKSKEILLEVLEWLEDFYRLPNIGEEGYDLSVSHEREQCRKNIKKLLDYPQWIVEGNDIFDGPIFLDLDIKYVKLLLN